MPNDNNVDRKKRIAIYDDTSNLCYTIPKLSEAIDRTIKNTIFYPHDKPIFFGMSTMERTHCLPISMRLTGGWILGSGFRGITIFPSFMMTAMC